MNLIFDSIIITFLANPQQITSCPAKFNHQIMIATSKFCYSLSCSKIIDLLQILGGLKLGFKQLETTEFPVFLARMERLELYALSIPS